MNERIKELAEQANIHFSRVGILDGDPNGSVRMVSYSKMEKFAELLIKECINQCNKNDPRPDAYSDWEEFAESRKVRECITSIKKHFGVE